MALSRTNVHSQASSDGHGTGNFTTTSFTPPSDSLLVVCVATMRVTTSTDLTSSITCSGGGWTYTARVGRGSSASVYSVSSRIFTAPVSTGASMTLTIGTGGVDMQFYVVSVVAYTGYDTTTPTGATGSLLVEDSGAPDGAQSFTLSGTPATTSEVVGAITLDKDAAGTTPGTGWTEIHDVQTGGAGGIETQIRTGSTSTSVAWVDTNTGGNIFKCVATGVEILVASAAGATVTPAVIALSATLPAPTVSVAAAPAVIARSVVMPAPAVSVAAAPAVITAPVTMPQATPAETGHATASPAVITAPVALPAPGVSVGAAPGVIVSTASLPAPVVSIGAAPGVVALVVAMPQATPGESGSVTASPAVIAAVVALPANTVSVAAAPSSIALAGTLPAPAVSISAAPAVIATGATLPAPALSVGAAPAAIALPITLPAPTIDSGGENATASPAVIGAVLSMPQPAVSVAAAPTVITAVVASPQAVPAIHYTATPSVIVSTITLPAPTVSVGAAPQVLAVIVSLPQATTSTGGGYTIHGRIVAILGGIEPPPAGGPSGVIG